MLASTIQFSKYGQENQPQPDTYQEDPHTRETTHPAKEASTVYRRPAPATNHTLTSVTVTQKKQSNLITQAGPIPQDPTARLGDPLGHSTFHAHK